MVTYPVITDVMENASMNCGLKSDEISMSNKHIHKKLVITFP